MIKLFVLIAVLGMLLSTTSVFGFTQREASIASAQKVENTLSDSATETTVVNPGEQSAASSKRGQSIHSLLKQKFIEGGPVFMTSILLCLILGLAIAIERIVYLNLASTNNDQLLDSIEQALNTGGIEAAKEVCRNTRGPVALIFYQGLDHSHEGLDVVEKTVVAYGGVQTSRLEKGLVWIALFIALGPMLGLLGTVIGIVKAFDAIEAAGYVGSMSVVSGIKVALLTTIAGLIVAMILQVFYNYSISKIDNIVTRMEDASISLIDILVKYNSKIS
jgi:biopolymer transport protein ExbB